MSILNAAVGQTLSPLVKPPIDQEQLRRYAAASGDYNPIHLDEEAARRVGLEGIIAHGMLSMAFLGQFVNHQIVDDPGARVAGLKVRYIGMVKPGDVITCVGSVKDRVDEAEATTFTLECQAQNQRGESVTVGEATIQVPRS